MGDSIALLVCLSSLQAWVKIYPIYCGSDITQIKLCIPKKYQRFSRNRFSSGRINVTFSNSIEGCSHHRDLGVGGTGKTTLARVVYWKMFNNSEGSCFITNIREESEKHGLLPSQQKLICVEFWRRVVWIYGMLMMAFTWLREGYVIKGFFLLIQKKPIQKNTLESWNFFKDV